MKRHKILQLSCYILLLGFAGLICLMPACNLFKDDTPPETEEDEKTDEETEDEKTEDEKTDEETEDEKTEDEKTDEETETPAELRYKKGTLVFIESGDYTYLAQVTKDIGTDMKEVPVDIFADHIREKMGDTSPVDKVSRKREVPDDGWGTRIVAAEYFESEEWTLTWDATEMEDHYLVPAEDGTEHRVEFKEIRFPIPLRR